jgi:transcriptional regulator with XRE-family HTH domain
MGYYLLFHLVSHIMEDSVDEINKIKEVLFFQKKTQKWLADQLGISTTAMTAICNNKTQPHLKDLKRIAKILDVDICELLVTTKKS